MVPYRAPGRVRQVAYLAILAVAATSASVTASVVGPWAAAPGCLAGYMLAYVLHEHALWRCWQRWHGMPDLSGSWRHDDERLVIRQTWTRLSISGTIDGQPMTLRLAGWRSDGARLQIAMTTPAQPLVAAELCLMDDGSLALSTSSESLSPRRWVRG